MAPAQRIRGIKPGRSLRRNGARIIAARLAELLSWQEFLHDASRVEELHAMRIAAKRLRYALEIFETCFSDVDVLLKELRDLQEDLGEIHDLDVFVDVLRARLHALEATLEWEATRIMGGTGDSAQRSAELGHVVTSHAQNPHFVGLVGLIGDKRAERARRHAALTVRWRGDVLSAFAALVTSSLHPRAPSEAPSSALNPT
jgi:hypothetical protein